MHVMGLDIGTQGARAIVCSPTGEIIAHASEPFKKSAALPLPNGWFEQNPDDWWEAAVKCIRSVVHALAISGIDAYDIDAIAVDSTSGTIVAVDANGTPLYPAIMYNDCRSEQEAEECNNAGKELIERFGYRFTSSFALPKMLWLKRREPIVFHNAAHLIHAADFIVGKLTGDFHISDTSNSLKTGYDLLNHRWPDFIESELGIPIEKLPKVFNPGDRIGAISSNCANETGMKPGTPVIAGVTDGTAGFFASGAVSIGDWNSTIGTTLVIRGVSKQLITDPQGRIYCHAHPQGYWLPGGASNVGAECIARLFEAKDLTEFDARTLLYAPSNVIVFPLMRRGERFPFINPEAEGFVVGEAIDEYDLYTAYLQGVGFVERWCYELLKELGAEMGSTIRTTGGGAKSKQWIQIRANILNKRILRPQSTECAVGTAVVAASGSIYSNLEDAASAMVKISDCVEPNQSSISRYDDLYNRFRNECAARGYE